MAYPSDRWIFEGDYSGPGIAGPENLCHGADRNTSMCLRDFEKCDRKLEDRGDDCPRALPHERQRELITDVDRWDP
jgi:hypothetical protein